jgi:hypothetical protein
MTNKSEALLTEFHEIINEYTIEFTNMLVVSAKAQSSLLQLSKDEQNALRSFQFTEQQIDLLRKVMTITCQGVVFGILSVFDGVSDVNDAISDIALIDRATMKEISDGYLHDEFVQLSNK